MLRREKMSKNNEDKTIQKRLKFMSNDLKFNIGRTNEVHL